MSSIYFTRINATELKIPIEMVMCAVPDRLKPTKKEPTKHYDYEQILSLGFKEGSVWCDSDLTAPRFTPNNRYYMANGNYMKVGGNFSDSPGLSLFTWFWGFDYKTIKANTSFTLSSYGSSIIPPNTTYASRVKGYFYTDGVNCYNIKIIYYREPSTQYPSGIEVEISYTSLTSLENKNIPYIVGIRAFFTGESLFENDTSSISGGQGNYDNNSDSVGLPPLPLLSPLDCGLFSMYAPNKTQLQEFSNYLWSSNVFDNLPKLFQDPMQAILNLSIIPVEFSVSTAQNIILGNLDTNINALTINNQFYEIDFGTIDLSEFWGSALDYDKTNIEIFLPFIAVQSIDAKDIMNCEINLKYRIDLLTGTCCAYLIVKRENTTSVLYQWKGNCSVQIPLTAQNFSQKISTLIGVGASVLGGAVAMSNPTTAGFGALALSATPTLLTQQQTHIQKIGSFQMESSYLGIWTPFITITRPKQSFASGYSHFKGYPSNITEIVGNVSGYCEVDTIHLENIPATSDELTEIENILKSGFII